MSRWKKSLWFLAAALAFCTGAFVWARDVRIPTNIAYVTEEEGGISVIDLGTLKVIKRIQPADVQPRGIAVTFDGKYLITANKNTSDIAVFSTPRLRLVKRIPIGHARNSSKSIPPATGCLLRLSPAHREDLLEHREQRTATMNRTSLPQRSRRFA